MMRRIERLQYHFCFWLVFCYCFSSDFCFWFHLSYLWIIILL